MSGFRLSTAASWRRPRLAIGFEAGNFIFA